MAKILVYDADAKFGEILKNALTSLGYEAVISNDGYNVLPLAEQHKPGLIILDYKLPEAGGFEILKRLRATKTCESTPIIFASATPKFEIEMTIMDAPFVGYIDKPLNAVQLRDAIKSLIRAETPAPKAAAAPSSGGLGYIAPPGAPLDGGPAPFTGEADLDGTTDEVIDLD